MRLILNTFDTVLRAAPVGNCPGAEFGGKATEHRPLGDLPASRHYCRLLNNASGPEVVEFGVLNGPLLPQNQLEKVVGLPPPFPMGFVVGGGRLDLQN